MKKLYLIRHAKSSWKDASLSDFERPLNKRGESDAPLMGKLLKKKQITPDYIISSPAGRAKRTAKIIAKEVGFSKKVKYDDNLYETSTSQIFDIIKSIDEDYDNVFMFGHNPSFSDVVEMLSGDHVENIPTAGIYCINFNVSRWDRIKKASGKTENFWFPKMFK